VLAINQGGSRNTIMGITIAFDVYGTLVNPLAMAEHLKPFASDQAVRFAELWRNKQLEYSFRRALMRTYQPFSVCTREALLYTEKSLGVGLAEDSRAELLHQYTNLPPFPEVAAGLNSLRAAGHFMAAFSNGEAEVVRALLGNAKLSSLLDEVVSADEIKTFKPDPALYAHAMRRLKHGDGALWLVSSNPFDIIGAKTAGLRAAWVRRNAAAIFDPWGVEPDLVIPGLDQLIL
jgi:2-haloacid dehalogenase